MEKDLVSSEATFCSDERPGGWGSPRKKAKKKKKKSLGRRDEPNAGFDEEPGD